MIRDLKELTNQNISITNSEEIKEGDWCFEMYNGESKATTSNFVDEKGNRWWLRQMNMCCSANDPECKKIILTTDQDLIKDGVQAIDDEFLEWFVKNPSCEEVNIDYEKVLWKDGSITHYKYQIIIPKEEPKQRLEKYSERFDNDKSPIGNPETWGKRMVEEPKQEIDISKYIVGIDPYDEPKQETLEEAAVRLYSDKLYPMYGSIRRDAFINGAKWQQEQDKNKYSEEEVLPIIEYIQWIIRKIDKENTPEEIVRLLLFYRDKIEQFKNK